MKRTVILFVLILGLISCAPTKYVVQSESELSRIDWERNMVNYIPIPDNDLYKSSILDTTNKLIQSKKLAKLDNYLSSVHFWTPDVYLAKTLYFISRNEYQEAADLLGTINENQFPLVRGLISIDLSYELTKKNKTPDFNQFLKGYQALIDKFPDDELLKKIIALRIRYIRYNY